MGSVPCVRYGSERRAVDANDAFTLRELGSYLFGLGEQQQQAIKKDIAPALGIDAKSRGEERKIAPGELDRINKAMALEMLMAHTLAGTDTPVISRANCVLSRGKSRQPSNFAPHRVPDVTVDYGNDYVVHAEVSAKKDMNEEYYEKQLQSALRHMQKTGAQVTLLVTDWGQADEEARTVYREFVRQNQEEMRQRNILLFSIQEFAYLAHDLAPDLDPQEERKRVLAKDMPRIFDALIEAARSGKKQNLGEVWTKEAQCVLSDADKPPPERKRDPSPSP